MALSFATKLMDKMPDYDEKIRKDFYDSYRKLDQELKKEYHEQNDALIDDLTDKLKAMMKAFHKEINK